VDEDVASLLESSATEDHAADSHEEGLVDYRDVRSVESAGGTEDQTATTSVGLRCFTCYSYHWPDAALQGHTTF
jgi:hypothetical protein